MEESIDGPLTERIGRILRLGIHVLTLQGLKKEHTPNLIWQVSLNNLLKQIQMFVHALDIQFTKYLDAVSELYNKVF